jgi:hypothetical protein
VQVDVVLRAVARARAQLLALAELAGADLLHGGGVCGPFRYPFVKAFA